MKSPEATLALVAAISAVIGLGQLLSSKEKITWRKAFGRAICAAGLGMGSAFVIYLIPFNSILPADVVFTAQLGLGCALASFGTSGIERLASSYLKK